MAKEHDPRKGPTGPSGEPVVGERAPGKGQEQVPGGGEGIVRRQATKGGREGPER